MSPSVGALRWAIVVADLEPIEGHEQGGTRRALVVSYESFHRSDAATICPITAARSTVRYPNEVAIPVGEAGQTKAGVDLRAQVRTISLTRVGTPLIPVGYLTDPHLRDQVRMALARQLGLDIPQTLMAPRAIACSSWWGTRSTRSARGEVRVPDRAHSLHHGPEFLGFHRRIHLA